MKKRMLGMLLAVAAFVVGIGAVKYNQIQTAIAQASSFQPPPEAVTTIVAKAEEWPATLNAIGTVAAVHGVSVSADLPGVVDAISFDSGRMVRQGEVLIRLDARQERAQLAAAQAQLELSRLNLARMQGLIEEGIISRAEHDRVVAEHKQAEARVGEIRATIERKVIRAPFNGLLGIRQVDRGQYLDGGSPIVPLQSLDPIYVNFTVPQQSVGQMLAGRTVQVTVEGMPGTEFTGKITAVDSVVDEATRNVQVQATLGNPGATLRPGMFVQAEVVLGERTRVLSLPASAISYAPYGDSVFVVGEVDGPNGQKYQGVRQQVVKLGATRGDQVAVLSGIKPGDSVVTSGVFKLRNGAAVQVNNDVQPSNDPAPKPEDN